MAIVCAVAVTPRRPGCGEVGEADDRESEDFGTQLCHGSVGLVDSGGGEVMGSPSAAIWWPMFVGEVCEVRVKEELG